MWSDLARYTPATVFDQGVKAMRILGVVLVIWLLIGALAAGQRGYFGGSDTSCAQAGTVLVTVIAGPLNYVGANPKVKCVLPQPSK
jgi:hypothetical protein